MTGQMVTIHLPEDTGGKHEWVHSKQGRCGSSHIPWEKIRKMTSVVNLRVKEGAELPNFIYSNREGKDGSPEVRVFDDTGPEIRGTPTNSWKTSLVEVNLGEGSKKGSNSPQKEGLALPDKPHSPSDESLSEDEVPLRVYFGKGSNLIILKEGLVEDEEEADVLVKAVDEYLGSGLSTKLKTRAWQEFQDESNRPMQQIKCPLREGDIVFQKIGGQNGKPVIHAVGPQKGKRQESEEELRAAMTIDTLIDQICASARKNKYHTVAMPIISGGMFGFNEVKIGTYLVMALLKKAENCPGTWIVCHPDAKVLVNVTYSVNQNKTAGEGRSDQITNPRQKSTSLRKEVFEYKPDPVLRKVKSSQRKNGQVVNPYPQNGKSCETFTLGKGSYRPAHARSRTKDTLLDKINQWDTEYAPGITHGQVWRLLNGEDATTILADTTLTQRAKRAILAHKDLTNRAAFERIIMKAVSLHDAGEDNPDSEDETDSDYERLVAERPIRVPRTPRKLRLKEKNPESASNEDQHVGANNLSQRLKSFLLGTPGGGHQTKKDEVVKIRPRLTLEELIIMDLHMKMLSKAKLENTTVRGKIKDLVRYAEKFGMPKETIDLHILAEFGLDDGRNLGKLLEEMEQNRFEQALTSIGGLSVWEELARKGLSVEGLIKLIFQAIRKYSIDEAEDFFFNSETSTAEKSKSKRHQPRNWTRRSGRGPNNRYEAGDRSPSHPGRKPESEWVKSGENRRRRQNNRGYKNRKQSKPRAERNDNDREKGSYISPEKWWKLTAEERSQILLERGKKT
ncbi:uncharacterized protein [Misgurnus anguillicaudatus]|uniref:uncharacterized protein n=1 Tax=Misgurnus anguillicaudatus TaxID=75329 RepID=UPI003CCF8DE8